MTIALAGGADIFAAFLIVFLFAVIYGLYTVRGSGIAQHPYGNVYSNAPGAYGPSELSGRDASVSTRWTRGTR
jgi:hypothetical protein